MKIIAYPTVAHPPKLRPAPSGRDWMDALPEAYGYRCLPLTMANAHGWEICSPVAFEAVWNGGPSKNDIQINCEEGGLVPTTHFGSGILTFHVGYLFRTEPGISLIAQGPVNRPKDGICALSGMIETDWSTYTFTMNWMFTRANTPVRFERDEPFCHVFPTKPAMMEAVEPVLAPFESDPETQKRHNAWSESRNTFNADLLNPDSRARSQKWQKDYYRGYQPDGEKGAEHHRTKLRLKPFALQVKAPGSGEDGE
ncbi:MAG: hypothetical protein JJ900_16935 [Rhodospirillales bacterium]|nr:hypothetical protein [Rhodospirillales bacterium]MBO6788535.1 hypothetical protein [Rhodospirillales bacterium]